MAAAVMVTDWLEHPNLLPPRPPTFLESKYQRLFAVDMHGLAGHDQYVFLAPNGVAVIGLAPGHPLIRQHRAATGYQPVPLHLSDDPSVAAALLLGGGSGMDEEDAAARMGPAGGDDMDEDAAADAGAGCTVHTAAPAASAGAAPSQTDSSMQQAGTAAGAGAAAAADAGAAAMQPATAFGIADLKRVNFDQGKTNRAHVKRSGKGKQQGTVLPADALVCKVESVSGAQHVPVWTGTPGKLLEVNQRLLQEPRLLLDRPCREGYVAILFPSPGQLRQIRQRLMTAGEYMQLRGLTAEELL